MLLLTFRLASEIQEVVIKGNELYFSQNGVITSIEGLRLSQKGVVKEFPDLEGKEEWKKEAINRFKEHMKKLETEEKKMNYIKEELTKQGYTALFYQKAGHRPQKFK